MSSSGSATSISLGTVRTGAVMAFLLSLVGRLERASPDRWAGATGDSLGARYIVILLILVLDSYATEQISFDIPVRGELTQMAKTEQIHIRVERELKSEAEAVLATLGLRPTEFVRMALKQVVLQRGLPFAVRIPNAETMAALNEPIANLQQFATVDELVADLQARIGDEGATEQGDIE